MSDDRAAAERRRARMAYVDALPTEVRHLVHEHGLEIIKAFLDCGVRKPNQINHLIATVRRGSGEVGKRIEPNRILGKEKDKSK